ncbi:MAG: hypothetical protein ABI347_08490 [Nitrososphaera sp.]
MLSSAGAHNSLRLALSSALGNDCADNLLRYLDSEGVFRNGRIDVEKLEQSLRSLMGDGAVALLRTIMAVGRAQ